MSSSWQCPQCEIYNDGCCIQCYNPSCNFAYSHQQSYQSYNTQSNQYSNIQSYPQLTSYWQCQTCLLYIDINHPFCDTCYRPSIYTNLNQNNHSNSDYPQIRNNSKPNAITINCKSSSGRPHINGEVITESRRDKESELIRIFIKIHSNSYQLFIPNDIIKLCLLYFHIPPLTASMLENINPKEGKRLIGEELFLQIKVIEPELAAKITGMLLEWDNKELLILLEDEKALINKVNEACAVLKEHTMERMRLKYMEVHPSKMF